MQDVKWGAMFIFIYSYRHSVIQVLPAEGIFLPQWKTVVTCLDNQLGIRVRTLSFSFIF